MNRFAKSFLIAAFVCILFFAGMYIYAAIAKYRTKELFKAVQNHEKLYVYETYFGALNAVMYVVNLKDTSALITYYQRDAKHDTVTNYINFEINTFPISLHEPIYVYNYLNKGSNIIQLVDFNTKCWGYIQGYVYKPTTHFTAPPDSLIKQEEAF